MFYGAFLSTALTLCAGSSDWQQRMIGAFGSSPQEVVTLTGQDELGTYRATIGPDVLKLTRIDRFGTQSWLDTNSSSTHRLWGGFVGTALTPRHHVRLAIRDVLTGSIVRHAPSAVGCMRRRSVNFATLRYAYENQVRILVELDPTTSLPRSADVFGTDFVSRLREMRYARYGSKYLLTHFTLDNDAFTFSDEVQSVETDFAALKTRAIPPIPSTTLRLWRSADSASAAIEIVIGTHKFRFLVDTGAPVTLITKRVARLLSLQERGRLFAIRSYGIEGIAVVTLKNMRVGRIRIDSDMAGISDNTYGYDGIIGLSLFSLGDVTLSENSIRIKPSPTLLPVAAGNLDTYDGRPIAATILNGQRWPRLIGQPDM